MPIERYRYPWNWEEISLEVRQKAGWRCEFCQRPCRQPGESDSDLVRRIKRNHSNWEKDLWDWVEMDRFTGAVFARDLLDQERIMIPRLTRFKLTAAHLNQDPSDNSSQNLKALCTVCHHKHDARFRVANSYRKRERRGQLNIFDLAPPAPAGHGKERSKVQLPLRMEVAS